VLQFSKPQYLFGIPPPETRRKGGLDWVQVGKAAKGTEVGRSALSSHLPPPHRRSGPTSKKLSTFQ
jgi:hypothetical protein